MMEKQDRNIAKDILATIAYYDAMDFPLTSFEVWKYLMRYDYYAADESFFPVGYREVLDALGSEYVRRFVEECNGFFVLSGRNSIIGERISHAKLSERKIRRLHSAVRLMRFAPFVRMVGMTGRLAMKNAQRKSDLDVLVVIKSGKIWTGRTCVTVLLHIFGLRRHGEMIKDRVCLNYFLTDESLEIATKDLFSSNEYYFLTPLFGSDVFRTFQLRNRWIRTIRPNYSPDGLLPLKVQEDTRLSSMIRSAAERLLGADFIEHKLRELETARIERNPKTYLEGGLVRVSEEALVFLPKPKGPGLFERFKKKAEMLHL